MFSLLNVNCFIIPGQVQFVPTLFPRLGSSNCHRIEKFVIVITIAKRKGIANSSFQGQNCKEFIYEQMASHKDSSSLCETLQFLVTKYS